MKLSTNNRHVSGNIAVKLYKVRGKNQVYVLLRRRHRLHFDGVASKVVCFFSCFCTYWIKCAPCSCSVRWMVLVMNAAGQKNATGAGGAADWLGMLFFGNGTITPGTVYITCSNSFIAVTMDRVLRIFSAGLHSYRRGVIKETGSGKTVIAVASHNNSTKQGCIRHSLTGSQTFYC